MQAPGEFIITFPRGYHAGFSNGFCIGEAANFAMGNWFSHGAEAIQRYCRLQHPIMFSQEYLLCTEARNLICEPPHFTPDLNKPSLISGLSLFKELPNGSWDARKALKMPNEFIDYHHEAVLKRGSTAMPDHCKSMSWSRCYNTFAIHADMQAADREGHVTYPAGKEFGKVMGQYFTDLQKAVAAGAQVKVSNTSLYIVSSWGASRHNYCRN